MPTENRSSNTEMVSEMLTCPFCGEKPQITKHHREDIYSFMHRCQVLGPISWGFREDQQAHIEKWNARAQPAPQPHPDPIAWMVGTAFWWTKEEAERDAIATGLPIVGMGPMTGVAEVERLSRALKLAGHWCDSALNAAQRVEDSGESLGDIASLLRHQAKDIEAALSASAEPSAPTWSCQPCQLEQPTDRQCDVCGAPTELIDAKS